MPKSAEKELPRDTAGEKSFLDHLTMKKEEPSSAQKPADGKRTDAADERHDTALRVSDDTNSNEKTARTDEKGLHQLADTVKRAALGLSKAEKKTEKETDRLSDADKTGHPKKKKAAAAAEIVNIELGIASIIAQLSMHRNEKPDTAKPANSDALLSSRAKESLLLKTAQLRKQLSSADQLITPPEEKASIKKADAFLARLEAMLKRNSPKELKHERIAALSEDIRKELAVVRKGAEKHAKLHAHETVAQASVRVEPAKQETAESAVQTKDGSSIQSVASASSSKSESDTQSGLGFMKQTHGAKEAQTAGREIASQIKGTPFAEHVDEIISKSKMTIRDGQNGSLAFRLNPDNLGGVNVSLGLENGVLTAKFLVDSQEAKETLASNMQSLKETLQQEGIQLGAFQVDVRAGHSGQSRDGDENPVNIIKGTFSEAEKVSQEYDAVSLPVHNGRIDMVI